MQASNFSKFTVQNASLPELVELYGSWVIGEGEFARKRRDRLEAGVPNGLTSSDFARSHDHTRTARCQVRTRVVSPTEWLLQWVHRQSNDRDVHWHNVVRLAADPAGVRVEHLVGRVYPPGQKRPPVAAPPQVISHLVQRFGSRIAPRNLFSGVRELDFRDAEDFVRHILMDHTREANIVVVSPTNSNRKTLVDAERLAADLAGMATVYVLAGPRTSWDFSEALERLELGRDFGCYDGAVRLYRPNLGRESSPTDHPLLLPWWIADAGYGRDRLNRTGGKLVELMTRQLNVAAWFNLIGRHDVDRKREFTEVLVEKTLPAPTSASEEALRSAVAERDAQIEELKGELKAHRELLDEAAADLEEAQERASAALAHRDEMEQERDEASHQAANAHNIATVADAVAAAATLFPDQLIVLTSAHRSADDCPYRNPDRVFTVLSLLAMSKGGRVFTLQEALIQHFGLGVKWRPKDSPQTVKKFKADRTFTCSRNTRKLFQEHITFGGSEDPVRNAQIYYDVLPNGKIEVAYVGRHLRTVSHNT